MKRILLLFLCIWAFSCTAQVNSIGKPESMVIWDILGTDTTIRTLYYGKWCQGNTMVLSVNRVLPDTLTYHPLYYFVNDTCVKQRIIYLKKHTWPLGTVSTVVDYIAEYKLDQYPNNQPSSFIPYGAKATYKISTQQNTPNNQPKNNNTQIR